VARQPDRRSVLVLGCGALARELLTVVGQHGLDHVQVECLPANLHNRPSEIPDAVRRRLETADGHDEVFVAYGDCGTGGRLDAVLEEFGARRLPGAHCYEFFAGAARFAAMHEAVPGTFYLTDYLARHFDRIVWRGLGLDRHPQLITDYFGNYQRVVHLAQTDDARRTAEAEGAAQRLGLPCERVYVGFGAVEPELVALGYPRKAAS
jgi:hypothetical protein